MGTPNSYRDRYSLRPLSQIRMLGLLVLLVAGASAQAPKPCCLTNQFTVGTSFIAGRKDAAGMGVVVEGVQEVVYDFDAKMLYAPMSSTDVLSNTTTNLVVLQDFNNMKVYYTNEDGSCYYDAVGYDMQPPCVSPNSTYMGNLTMGVGSNTLTGHAWNWKDDKADYKMVVTEDCAPIIMAAYGNVYGLDQEITYFYYNFKTSIADRSVFTVPTDCKPVPTAAPGGPAVGR